MLGRPFSRVLVALLTSVVLTVTLVTPVQAVEVPATVVDPLTIPFDELPAGVPSPAVDIPDPVVPEGEFDASEAGLAPLPSRGFSGSGAADDPEATFDADTSVVAQRDEFTTTYDNADGSHTLEIGGVPQNVLVDDEWVPISTDVSTVTDGWAAQTHPLEPQFLDTASDENAFSVSNSGFSVGFTLEGAGDSVGVHRVAQRSSVGADRVAYSDVLDGVDLTYDVDPDRVKEILVLDALPAIGHTMWRWTVDAPGLSLSKNEFGDIVFADASGVQQFLIPTPVMWDSSGVEGVREPVEHTVDTVLFERSDGTWSLTLSADRDWLADPSIVYPVHVDPTVQLALGESVPRSYKSDGTVITGSIYVGNSRDGSTNKYWRGIARYAYEYAYGKQVVSAYMYAIYDGAGTTDLYQGLLHTATGFSYSGVGEDLSGWVDGDPYAGFWVAYEGWTNPGRGTLSARIAQWVRDQTPNQYLMVRGAETAGSYTYKDIYTQLRIDYIDFPTVTSVSPVVNAAVSVTPVLQASGTDPSQVGVQYDFQVFGDADHNSTTPYTLMYRPGWSSVASAKVPAGILEFGASYEWMAGIRTGGGYDGWLGTSTERWTARTTITATVESVSPTESTALPGADEIVTSETPALSAALPTGVASGTQYQFRLTTGADGRTGVIAASGWLPVPAAGERLSWSPPAGTLVAGTAYTWGVVSKPVGATEPVEPDWFRHFRYDRRIGAAGPSPTDSAGPVTVNLANGNVSMSFSSPTVTTVGGPMGMAFNYNSQQENLSRGLNVSYYNALTGSETTPSSWEPGSKTPVLQRVEPVVKFDAGLGSPVQDVVPSDNFIGGGQGFCAFLPPAATRLA